MKTTKLIDVADIIYGYAFDSKLFNTSGEGRPLIRIRDVNTGFSNTYTTENAPEKYSVRNGDFLIGMDGNFEIVKWANGDALLNQRVCKIIPKSIKPDYLFYLLSPILKNIENKTHSTTVKHLSAKELNKISFELPNGNQQSKIANELSDLHRMLTLKREALEGLDSLVKSRFMEMFGDPNDNPLNWKIGKISDVAKCVAGATPSTSVPTYWENGSIPWLSSGEVNKYRIYETDSKITQEGYAHTSTKMVPAHTVVLAMAGQGKTRGTAAMAEISLCTNQSICSLVNNEKINPEFLLALLKNQYDELRAASNGAEGRGGLNLKIIGSFPIYIPPIELQNDFARFVELIDKSRFIVQSQIKDLQELLDSKMEEYFGGDEE